MKRLLDIALGLFLLLALYACHGRNQLPNRGSWPRSMAEEPVQIPIEREPFSVVVEGRSYTVRPRFEYSISGMVVSCGFSRQLAEYRNDLLNVMDAGIIWGSNLDPDVYRNLKFRTNGVWLEAETPERAVWERFDHERISNNHLLTTNAVLRRRLQGLRRGDMVALHGALVDYGSRRTSRTRSDTGARACEIIWVDRLELLERGSLQYIRLFRASLVLLAVGGVSRFILAIRG